MNPLELDRQALKADLVRDEGLRLKPYLDTVGKTTIGVGRNLTDRGISQDEAMAMLDRDMAETIAELRHALPWWDALDGVRKRVLVNMGFNLGVPGLMKWPNTLQRIADGDYKAAAAAMRGSKWASQVGARAERLSKLMERGADEPGQSR